MRRKREAREYESSRPPACTIFQRPVFRSPTQARESHHLPLYPVPVFDTSADAEAVAVAGDSDPLSDAGAPEDCPLGKTWLTTYDGSAGALSVEDDLLEHQQACTTSCVFTYAVSPARPSLPALRDKLSSDRHISKHNPLQKVLLSNHRL